MSTRIKKLSQQPVDILLTTISKESTCNDFPLPLKWTCELCMSQRDMTLNSRDNAPKKQRHKTARRRCLQIWDCTRVVQFVIFEIGFKVSIIQIIVNI